MSSNNICKRCGENLEKQVSSVSKEYCSNNCQAWDIIINMFREAHKGEQDWSISLDNINRILTTKMQHETPNPVRFATMLSDRGVKFSEYDKKVWNLACDECIGIYYVTRYHSDDKVKQFIGRFFDHI